MTDFTDANPVDLAPSWKSRGIAALRFLGFFVLAALLTGLAVVGITRGLGIKVDLNAAVTPRIVLIAEGAQALAMVVVPTAIMMALGRQPIAWAGLGRGVRWRELGLGLACGIGLMSAMLAVLALLGVFSFGRVALGPLNAVRYGLGYGLAFGFTAIAEEGLLRGYGLVQLSRAISFWPAAVLTSLVFLALHLGHQAETLIGLSQVALVGMVLAYSFRRSGALWFALGFHAAWDYAETFVFGVPDSGVTAVGALMAPRFHGPDWLTGGSVGPEGSVLTIPTLLLLGVIAHVALKPRGVGER